MRLSTNTIIIIFGILALAVTALFPISIVAAQVIGSQSHPDVDPQATVQAIVTQTVMALTLAAPNPDSTHADHCSGHEHTCAHLYTCFLL
jgi:hypothetical protein